MSRLGWDGRGQHPLPDCHIDGLAIAGFNPRPCERRRIVAELEVNVYK